MGKGNSIISDSEGNSVDTFYIEYYEHDEEWEDCPLNQGKHECICNDTFLDDVLGNIEYSICPEIKGLKANYEKIRDIDFDNVFSNNFMEVKLNDNEWSLAIGCCPKYNDNGKIINKMIYLQQANKFMKELNKMYSLCSRGCAWTSGKVEQNENKFY